ncbi:MAG: hypothetical protein P4M05_30360 [Bradyrhizobium sp.]|nr:hypothetical protein [Bradyrhizobium sp.]
MDTHTQPPAEPQDAVYFPTDTTPEELFVAIGRLRKEARDEIDRLIGFLDHTDDYVSRELEVEDGNDEPGGDDEPSLGSINPTTSRRQAIWSAGDTCDHEHEHDGREPGEDDEPSLGSSNDHNGHGAVYDNSGGGVIDGEGPDDDLEPSLGGGDGSDREEDRADEEPSLGWTERAEEGGGYCGGFEDREQCVAVGTKADYERFRASKIDGDPAAGVDVERGYGTRRIRNLSDRQRQILRPKVDDGKVSV